MRHVCVIYWGAPVLALCVGFTLVCGVSGCGGTAAVTTPPTNVSQANASRDYFKTKPAHKRLARKSVSRS